MGRLADLFRQKMEKMEAKLSNFSASTQSKIRTQRMDVVNPQGQLTRMKSSWIRSFAYDNLTQTLYMTVHTGKTYSWLKVPAELAKKIVRGDAACGDDGRGRVNGVYVGDPTGQDRWWYGKNPSLGAAYWHYLKNYATQGPGVASGQSYMDIALEGYEPMYNVTDLKRGKGRPTKSDVKAGQFGWAGRYKKPKVGGTP